MQIAIIISSKDPAGLNIKEHLAQLFEKTNELFDNFDIFNKKLKNNIIKLYTTEKDSINLENIDNNIEADLFIFATKHRSEQGTHSLSCHSPGNWHKADFGGKENTLGIAPSHYLKDIFLLLKQYEGKIDSEITLEVTHHGPDINKPAFFIEIGSDENEWKKKEKGRIISNVIIDFLNNFNNKKSYQSAVGIGGPHYASTFNKVMERTDIALGHICPKYVLPFLTKELIQQAIEKTIPKPEYVILDWKGLGKEKSRIIEMLNELKIEYKRTDRLQK